MFFPSLLRLIVYQVRAMWPEMTTKVSGTYFTLYLYLSPNVQHLFLLQKTKEEYMRKPSEKLQKEVAFSHHVGNEFFSY